MQALNQNLQNIFGLMQQQQPQGQNAGARRTKVRVFSSGDAVEWMEWIRQFRMAVQTNGWGNRLARRELAMAMDGEARHLVQHIDPGEDSVAIPNDADVQPLAELVAAYQAVFVPVGGTEAAKEQLWTAKQEEDEGLKQWHSRIRMIYCRAYPQIGWQDLEVNSDLRTFFIKGLKSFHLKDRVGSNVYANYTEAFNEADRLSGWLNHLNQRHGAQPEPAAVVKREPRVHAMDPREGTSQGGGAVASLHRENRRCFECNKQGHIAKDCYSRGQNKAPAGNRRGRGNARQNPSPYPRDSRGRGSGNRGRSHRGRGGGRSAPRINAIEEDDPEKRAAPQAEEGPDYAEAYGEDFQ